MNHRTTYSNESIFFFVSFRRYPGKQIECSRFGLVAVNSGLCRLGRLTWSMRGCVSMYASRRVVELVIGRNS